MAPVAPTVIVTASWVRYYSEILAVPQTAKSGYVPVKNWNGITHNS